MCATIIRYCVITAKHAIDYEICRAPVLKNQCENTLEEE